jgi:hypothetical protein
MTSKAKDRFPNHETICGQCGTTIYKPFKELSNEEIEAVSKECMSYLPSIQGWFSNTHELDIYKFANAILKKARES